MHSFGHIEKYQSLWDNVGVDEWMKEETEK